MTFGELSSRLPSVDYLSFTSVSRRLVLNTFARMTRGSLLISERGGADILVGSASSGQVASSQVSVSSTPTASSQVSVSSTPTASKEVALKSSVSESAAPALTMRILDDAFYTKCLLFGAIGLAESYIDGDWETTDLVALITFFIDNLDESSMQNGVRRKPHAVDLLNIYNRLMHILRENNPARSRKNISAHYDLGNDFFSKILDPTMTYSSALFAHPLQNLEGAQKNKIDTLCKKLLLKPGDRVLEIGSGWGTLAIRAAQRYGCKVKTITLSREQYEFVSHRIKELNLGDQVEVCLEDYRNVEGKFDKIVSVEMVEALGDNYIDVYFRKCHELLNRDGILGIQMIITPDCRYESLKNGVDFIQKHIFPGSQLLSINRVSDALRKCSDLYLYDLVDMAPSYAKTLNLWRQNMLASRQSIMELGFDEAFMRKWIYYFCYCEAAFATRQISVVQAVYTRPNNRQLAEVHAL